MDPFQSLSVGQVSGLIALVTSVLTYTTPLLMGIFLLRYHDREATAATWSVVARQLHSSSWPSLLRTDSAAIRFVDRRVTVVVFLNGILALLILVAGITTPLGIYDEIASLDNRTAEFIYLKDTTSFGFATQLRPEYPLARDCGAPNQLCPGAEIEGPDITVDGEDGPITTRPSTVQVPQKALDLFSSLSRKSTIAGILDIQYRFWKRQVSVSFDSSAPYVAGLYRQVNNLIPLGKGATLVDGIVADMDNGGLGYRNHTAPVPAASWDEDILWIAPEISCTSTGLSFEMVLEAQNSSASVNTPVGDVELVDDGGFSGLSPGQLDGTWPDFTYESHNVQHRASKTAWYHNALLAIIFNLTDVASLSSGANIPAGGRYRMNPDVLNNTIETYLFPIKPTSTGLDPSWFGIPQVTENEDGSLNSTDGTFANPEEHPYQYASLLISQLQQRCNGANSDAIVLENEPNVECGYFLSSPVRTDGGSPLEEEGGSKWKSSISICAGTLKASVKTVWLDSNATVDTSLASMSVSRLADKAYANPSEHPVWAVENWRYPGNEGARSVPLWGIVDESYEGTEGYNFTRSPEIYLPPSDLSRWQMTSTGSGRKDVNLKDMLAGTIAPRGVLAQVLTSAFQTDQMWLPNYSGLHCLALRAKWQEMSKTEEGIANILRLVWTDIMASVTVGAKCHPLLSTHDQNTPDGRFTLPPDALAANTLVTIHGRRLAYNWKYAAPALLLIFMWVVLAIAAMPVVARHRPFSVHLRRLLNDTSLGRSAAIAREKTRDHDGDYRARMWLYTPTWDWLASVGILNVRLGPSNMQR